MNALLNHLRLSQGGLVQLITLGLAATGTLCLCLGVWLAAVVCFALTALNVTLGWQSVRLWTRMGHGLRYHQDGHQEHAAAALQLAEADIAALPATDPRRAVYFGLFGAIKQAQGDFTAAEEHYRHALRVSEAAWGPDHEYTRIERSRLAGAYLEIAQFAQAEPLMLEVLRACERQKPRSLLTAEALWNLGRLEATRERFDRAEMYVRRALDIVAGLRGDEAERRRSLCLMQLGYALLRQDRVDEAEAIVPAAVDALERGTGPEHPRLGPALEVLALLRLQQGRLPEAEQHQRRALAIIGKYAGGEHPCLARGLHQLGEIMKAQRRDEEAETFYRKALALREEYLAPEHPAIAESLAGLADLLTRTGRVGEGRECWHRAEQIRAVHGPQRVV